MATPGKTEKELWEALKRLDDDLLDLNLPDEVVDQELLNLGVDPVAVGKRGLAFLAQAKEEHRLAWQTKAKQRRAELEARVARSASSATEPEMGRVELLARLELLRASSPGVGSAIKMAARKRKPKESTVEELRVLVQEMEALRAIEADEPE